MINFIIAILNDR